MCINICYSNISKYLLTQGLSQWSPANSRHLGDMWTLSRQTPDPSPWWLTRRCRLLWKELWNGKILMQYSLSRCLSQKRADIPRRRWQDQYGDVVTYSVDSILSDGVRIIIRQLMRMVAMMMRENKGWTNTWMATRRTGENGDRNHMESSAEKRKISLPLLMTIKVFLFW